MAIEVRGSSGGVTILWNPSEIIFQDWRATLRVFTGYFRYIGTKELLTLTIIYGPSVSTEKTSPFITTCGSWSKYIRLTMDY